MTLRDDVTHQDTVRRVLAALRTALPNKELMAMAADLLEESEVIIKDQNKTIAELVEIAKMLKDVMRGFLRR